ncbi:GNAT family N-acetyltransferase [Jiangella muralis]|uniref:GNAT family N-acetyltransferase n=1 Tax=Jiangella muralis TaxID=702383 RepID=UPI000A5A3B05
MLLAPEARGQGYTADAAMLTLDWGFHLAAVRMVWLKVLEPNAHAIRAYERAGFRPAGRLRQAGWWYGESCDELLMDAVRADFPGPSRVPGRDA